MVRIDKAIRKLTETMLKGGFCEENAPAVFRAITDVMVAAHLEQHELKLNTLAELQGIRLQLQRSNDNMEAWRAEAVKGIHAPIACGTKARRRK